MSTNIKNSVYDFMSLDSTMSVIQKLLQKSNYTFDSHAFIRCFTQKFQVEYVKWLYQETQNKTTQNKKITPFKNVHQQISNFLKEKKEKLYISDIGITKSKDIFGNDSDNKNWRNHNKYATTLKS